MRATRAGFEEAMDDDFNTSGALSQLFEYVRAINHARDDNVSEAMIQEAQAALLELAAILGLRLDVGQDFKQEAAPFIDLLIEVRRELRSVKQWDLADVIRKRLSELGVDLEDSKGVTTWKKH